MNPMSPFPSAIITVMSPASGTRATTRRPQLKLVLVLYMVAAALMPLAHHDIACHLKSTTHCTTCNVGSSAETSSDVAALSAVVLDEAGYTTAEPDATILSVSVLAESGRAPPSIA